LAAPAQPKQLFGEGGGKGGMIPTRSKSKLPKVLSYPLGAEAISEALADAPHLGELSLSFYDQAVWPSTEFNRLVRKGLPYRMLSAAFMPPRKVSRSAPTTLVEGGWYQAHWSITVYPVLRELRHAAGQLLRGQGLPAVAEWLRSSERAGWDTRQHRLDLVFSPAEGTLSAAREDSM
jgi:hypothetical protein